MRERSVRCRLGPLAAYFKLQALPAAGCRLPAADYGGLVAIGLGCSTLVTWMKRVCIWRYGW